MLTTLFTSWPHFSRVAVVDILLVALIIYEFLALIKGTRASFMLIGVGAIALAFYVSRLGDLPTLNWLLTTLFPYTVFGLIVVFAVEIRQALARLGRRLTLSRTSSAEADAYDDIILAANLFSQNQTGALMVIERDIGLRSYIESGVPLDAHLSYDLLATIFRPSAPLHDGAVIVQKDRIAAAACFLPLSMNPVLSTQLGTRHRAGIGITEETDAIAVIISEETGGISLAMAGIIYRDLTIEELRSRLAQLLRQHVSPSTLPAMMGVNHEQALEPASRDNDIDALQHPGVDSDVAGQQNAPARTERRSRQRADL
ncbi:MAG: TIGR00159 family protein [Acidobacteriales bacterium]|nr:TIGR00159 family protein [Terriglobales bacterium]